LIEDKVIQNVDFDELKVLIEFLKMQAKPVDAPRPGQSLENKENIGEIGNSAKNFDKIVSVLINLEFDEEQKNYVVSLCYELGLLKPLISIFVGNIHAPDYFSCLNILMSQFQTALAEKNSVQNSQNVNLQFKAENIIKQILDLIKNGLERISATKRQLNLHELTKKEVLQVKVKILDQLLLWLLNDQIFGKLFI
jgi:hypothetical protein